LTPFHDDAASRQISDALLGLSTDRSKWMMTHRPQMAHRFFAVNDAAAGGDDGVRQVGAEDVVLFDLSEGCQAVVVDDLLQGSALNRLDQNVRIDKVPARALASSTPTVLLPTPASNQHDVLVSGVHSEP